ncbi:MAG: C39 family peptidase [Verrucomicrobiota bacterium]
MTRSSWLKSVLAGWFGWLGISAAAGADFPSDLILKAQATWDSPAFAQSFAPATSPTRIALKTFPGKHQVLGLTPQVIIGRFEGQRIESISIIFHDAGFYFGYVPRGSEGPDRRSKEAGYDAQFSQMLKQLRESLTAISEEKAEQGRLGGRFPTPLPYEIYQHGDVHARLVAVPHQLIKLTLFRSREAAEKALDPEVEEMSSRDRDESLIAHLRETEWGDTLIDEIPIFPQGNRAYCGVASLSMTLHFLGVNLETEELAAGSSIQYGSTREMLIREIYVAAADEGDIRASRSTSFDFKKAKDSIDDGVPVIVFRRYDQQRDYLHTTFAKRFERDRTAQLPTPDLNDQATWPGKTAPAHATIINGYNEARGEVIFTESWGEHVRNRRMRAEEMEGTAYYAFYFRL